MFEALERYRDIQLLGNKDEKSKTLEQILEDQELGRNNDKNNFYSKEVLTSSKESQQRDMIRLFKNAQVKNQSKNKRLKALNLEIAKIGPQLDKCKL